MHKILSLAAGCICLFAHQAHAYGPDGHKIIGAIADQRLVRTAAGARVSQLLDGYTLEEVSIIADTIKQWDKPGVDDPNVQQYFSSHPAIAEQLREFWKANLPTDDPNSPVPSHHWFHYTDVPLAGNEDYAGGKTGRSKWDIVHMMRYCIDVLGGNISASNERKITRPIALILLAHYVGDIHQPLHVGAEYFDRKGNPVNPDKMSETLPDEGGNSLRLKLAGGFPRKRDPKFHGYWDTDAVLANLPLLPETMPKELRQQKRDLAVKSLTSQLAKVEPMHWEMSPALPVEDYPEQWANEILPIAREAHRRLHYQNIAARLDNGKLVADGELVEKPGEHEERYEKWAAHVVFEEMHKAGWRLADLLVKVLTPDEKPQSQIAGPTP
jgi:hypothetical protein